MFVTWNRPHRITILPSMFTMDTFLMCCFHPKTCLHGATSSFLRPCCMLWLKTVSPVPRPYKRSPSLPLYAIAGTSLAPQKRFVVLLLLRIIPNLARFQTNLIQFHKLLVLRRRVSAKRRIIVFSTVRPSLRQIIELSKKNQVYYTFNGIIRPMKHVRLSVCLSVRLSVCPSVDTWVHFFVRTSARLSFDGLRFPLARRKNIYWSCDLAYYF